ncbi:hypothetical protein ONZ45_g1305 [Pleurotus djamor]|nr:hypothetical protein ONZ45_g1305 [Pleurotus djamor]
MQLFALTAILALALRVSAHGAITAVTGANGVTAQGFGVVATTPRTGSRRNPFQQDSSIIRDREISQGTAGVCGRTLGGGNNDVQTMLATASSAGLPMAAADGSVSMTLHQVNGDGAGPYTCQVSSDASGQNFVAMTITTQVPGRNSRSRASATPFPLVAQMPAGMTCTGGPNGDACLVRCRNAARAGPFGGCVAVTTANSGNAAAAAAANANANAAAAANANATAAGAANANAAGAATGAATGTANAAGTAVAGTTAAANTVAGNVVAPAPVAAPVVAQAAAPVVASVAAPVAQTAPVAVAAVANTATGVAAQSGIVARTIKVDADEPSIEEAELALAQDLDRRVVERVRRSRIIGHRAL